MCPKDDLGRKGEPLEKGKKEKTGGLYRDKTDKTGKKIGGTPQGGHHQ